MPSRIGGLYWRSRRTAPLAQIPVTDVAGNAQWLQQTITQIKSLAQQAQQYGTQLAQYQTELNQYTNMVTNTVALPTEVWSTVQSDIMRVQALSNASSLLSGSSGSLITRLQNASAYANQVGSLANIGSQISAVIRQTIGNEPEHDGQDARFAAGAGGEQRRPIGVTLQQHSQTAAGQDAGHPGRQ